MVNKREFVIQYFQETKLITLFSFQLFVLFLDFFSFLVFVELVVCDF